MSVYFLMAQPGTLVLKRAAFAAITMFCTVFLWKQLTMPGLSPNPTTKLPNYGVSLKSVSLVYCETGMMPGEFHGQRGLAGYSAWSPEGSDMIE